MTVTEVILNFRAALVAVLPMVEVIGVPWKRGDAYDEWDNLASCLYMQLVGSLMAAIDSADGVSVRLAAYDMMLPDYRNHSIIRVQNSALGAGRWVFHAFGTVETPFDVVEVRELTCHGVPCGDGLHTCPIEGSRFSLTLPNGSSLDQVPRFFDVR